MNNIERITQDIFDSLSKPFATIRGISTATKKNTYRVVNIVKLKQIKHSVLIPVFLSISVCHYFLSNNAQAQPRNYGAVIACDASMGEGFGFNFRKWNSGGAYCHTEWETISCLFLGCLIGHRVRRPQESLLPMSWALMRGVYRLRVMQAFALKAQRVLSITPILTIIKSRPWQTPQMIKTPLTVAS